MIVTKETPGRGVDLSSIPAVVPNLVGGADALAADGGTFAKIDPATGRELCRVARSTASDVRLAVEAARRAQPAWAAMISPATPSGWRTMSADLLGVALVVVAP